LPRSSATPLTALLAALGRLAEDRARWDQAESWYRRGLAAAPDDPLVQYLGGSYLLRRGGDIAAARDALRRSIQADPSYAPAWVALAGSFVAAGDRSAEAIESGETAHRLLPERTDVTANLLGTSPRRRDGAPPGREALPPTRRQRMALRVIARSDVDRARRLIEDGRREEAQAALGQAEAALAASPDDELVRRHIEALRSSIVDARMTERYNEAANAYNAGEVDRARELLLALRDEAPPGRHAEAVASFLTYLDDPAAGPPPPAPLAPSHAARPGDIERLNELIAANRLERTAAGGPPRAQWRQSTALDRLKIDDIGGPRDNRFIEAYNARSGSSTAAPTPRPWPRRGRTYRPPRLARAAAAHELLADATPLSIAPEAGPPPAPVRRGKDVRFIFDPELALQVRFATSRRDRGQSRPSMTAPRRSEGREDDVRAMRAAQRHGERSTMIRSRTTTEMRRGEERRVDGASSAAGRKLASESQHEDEQGGTRRAGREELRDQLIDEFTCIAGPGHRSSEGAEHEPADQRGGERGCPRAR
jgi:hypothetical protein